MPKVIDFGVARALEPQADDGSVFQAFGQMVGTPQ